MAIINCKNCGGNIELSADKTFGTCEFCGSTMTFPKIDDDQRAAAFNRGNHFRRIGEFDKALAVYERIVAEDNTDAEAHWCCALCRFGIEYVEDPVSFEWIPTCHRASFDSFLEDVDYLAALEYSDGLTRRQYQKDAAKIAEVQRGILATSQNSEPYDVFICYKESDENGDRTRDSQLAQDIYYQLKEQGRKVFFARITLEDVVGTQYEPYIFAALNSAKVMVVVGTKPEYLNAVWVKNEWSRFLAMMKKDRSKLLLPCYRDMDPYDLPEQLSVLQSYDMGKIGFIQDLIRGIAKVLDADKKPEPVKETVREAVVIQEASSTGNADALLDRGYMALGDLEWEKADNFFEKVLNQNARCAEAYIGKFLASKKQPTLKAQISQTLKQTENAKTETKNAIPRDEKRENEILETRVVPHYLSVKDMKPLLSFDRTYTSALSSRQNHVKAAGELFVRDKYLSKAMSFASGETLQELKKAENYLVSTMERRVKEEETKDKAEILRITEAYEKKLEEIAHKADELRKKAETRREEDYQKQLAVLNEEFLVHAEKEKNEPRVKALLDAKGFFEANKTYKDCAGQVRKSEQLLEELKTEQAHQVELAEKKENRKFTIGVLIGVLVFLLLILYSSWLRPAQQYKLAESYMQSGDYKEAANLFLEVSNYQDAQERYLDALYAEAEKLMQAGDYAESAKILRSLNSQRDDTIEKYREAILAQVWERLSDNDLDEVLNLLEQLLDYSTEMGQNISTKEFMTVFRHALIDRCAAADAGKSNEVCVDAELSTMLSFLGESFEDKALQEKVHVYVHELLRQKEIIVRSYEEDFDSKEWSSTVLNRYTLIEEFHNEYGLLSGNQDLISFYVGRAAVYRAKMIISDAITSGEAYIWYTDNHVEFKNTTEYTFSMTLCIEYPTYDSADGTAWEILFENVQAGEELEVPNSTGIKWDTFDDWDNINISFSVGSIYLGDEYIGEGSD